MGRQMIKHSDGSLSLLILDGQLVVFYYGLSHAIFTIDGSKWKRDSECKNGFSVIFVTFYSIEFAVLWNYSHGATN